jgi:hypothetical protein
MTSFDLERWKILSPHLDRALELGVDDLAGWLEALRRDEPAIAADLERLLAERDAIGQEHFLEDFALQDLRARLRELLLG